MINFIVLALFLVMADISFGQMQDGYELLTKEAYYKLPDTADIKLLSLDNFKDTAGRIDYIETPGQMLVNKELLMRNNPKDMYFYRLGEFLSFIGDHKRARASFDSVPIPGPDKIDSLDFKVQRRLQGLELRDARKLILDSAAAHTILMINEAHHKPEHRILTYTVLKDLYALGYRNFGLETLSDFAINEPISGRTGYYTQEPSMGELVRYAREIGYNLFAYESNDFDGRLRDSIQAENIILAVAKKSKGKFLIHAGYGHISESTPMMAKFFKTKTNINPFTVDQVQYSESNRSIVHKAEYHFLNKTFKESDTGPYAILQNGKLYQLTPGMHDLYIYTPPAKYQNGRPVSLLADGIRARKTITIPTNLTRNCFLIQAYFQNEYSTGKDIRIPLDQTYFFYNSKADLYLRKGIFTIVYRDIKNKIIGTKEMTVN